MTAVTVPAKVARNLTRSFFEMAHKRCNSNGRISKFEMSVGELRAKLLSGEQDKQRTATKVWPVCGTLPRKGRAWLRCPWAAGPDGARNTRGAASNPAAHSEGSEAPRRLGPPKSTREFTG